VTLTAPAGADTPNKHTRQKPSAQHDRLHNIRPTLKPLTGIAPNATHVRELRVRVVVPILLVVVNTGVASWGGLVCHAIVHPRCPAG